MLIWFDSSPSSHTKHNFVQYHNLHICLFRLLHLSIPSWFCYTSAIFPSPDHMLCILSHAFSTHPLPHEISIWYVLHQIIEMLCSHGITAYCFVFESRIIPPATPENQITSTYHPFRLSTFFPNMTTRTPPLASITLFSSGVIVLANNSSTERMLPMLFLYTLLSFCNTCRPVFSATDRNPPSSPPTLNPECPSVYNVIYFRVR